VREINKFPGRNVTKRNLKLGVGVRTSLENTHTGWHIKHTREKEKMGKKPCSSMEDCDGTRRMLKEAQLGRRNPAVGLIWLVSSLALFRWVLVNVTQWLRHRVRLTTKHPETPQCPLRTLVPHRETQGSRSKSHNLTLTRKKKGMTYHSVGVAIQGNT